MTEFVLGPADDHQAALCGFAHPGHVTGYRPGRADRVTLAQLPTMAFTLVLLRHAKSAYPTGVPDHDRPLNTRGEGDAPAAGRQIRQAVGFIEVALVSTATRAQQTWQLSGVQAGSVQDRPDLYLASWADMLEVVRGVDASSAIVVAHNPGTEDLAARLTSDTGSAEYARMLAKFPTAAFAVLRADVPFARWDVACARLVSFEVGRA